jgi:hypothetical protein
MTTTAAVGQPSAQSGTDAMIEVEDVSKAFGPVQAPAGASLHAQAGRLLSSRAPLSVGLIARARTSRLRTRSPAVRPAARTWWSYRHGS